MTTNSTRRLAPLSAPITLLITALLVMASCASDPSTASGDPAIDGAADTSLPDVTSTIRPIVTRSIVTTASTPATTTTNAVSPEDTDEQGTQNQDETLRLAPATAEMSQLLIWDRQGFQNLGHAGRLGRADIDGLDQVTAVPLSSPVFQVSDNDRVIWQLADNEVVSLLSVPESEGLTLEGAGVNADDDPVIFYQHHVYADPENTRSTLRSFNVFEGTSTEIATTGGWESGVHFSHLSPTGSDRSNEAVALWGAEGWEWLESLDIRTGEVSFDSQDLGLECFSGDLGCPNFGEAVAFDGDVIGTAPAPTGNGDVVDAFGLWRFDTGTGTVELIESWPWDNGVWYVEDMFMFGDSVLVLSLEDGSREPLPALFFDLVSGESWTEPEPGFLRPTFLT